MRVMQLFRFLFIAVVLIVAGGVAFMLAPESFKEKGLEYVSRNPYIPAEVKKTVDNFYATPAIKRKRLVQELETNLADLKKTLEEKVGAGDPSVQLVERSKEIVAEVLQQNDDPTIIKQITEAVTAKLLSSGDACVKPQN